VSSRSYPSSFISKLGSHFHSSSHSPGFTFLTARKRIWSEQILGFASAIRNGAPPHSRTPADMFTNLSSIRSAGNNMCGGREDDYTAADEEADGERDVPIILQSRFEGVWHSSLLLSSLSLSLAPPLHRSFTSTYYCPRSSFSLNSLSFLQILLLLLFLPVQLFL
jgi:hypothetical protein